MQGTGQNAGGDYRNGSMKPGQSQGPQKRGAKYPNQQKSAKELFADIKMPGPLFDETWKKMLPKDNFRFQSICPTEDDINDDEYPDPPENIVHMAYDSTEQYLETHFQLLRADCIMPVRDAIRAYRAGIVDDNEMMIYKHVRPVALLFATIGMVHRVSFVVDGRRVNWRQSKRLIPGTIVCLSTDDFQNFRFATVVERELESLQDPRDLKIGIKFIHPDPQQDFDPDICYTMIEAMQGYFEAYKHVLKCLQDIDPATMPFQPQLVGLEHDQSQPEYSTNIGHKWDREFLTKSILEFPKILKEDDSSVRPEHRSQENSPEIIVERDIQPRVLEAVKRMLTDEFAVLQGPPGTGKTFLSLLAMHILLKSCRTSDTGPIIVVCQTNHALDQFLEGILRFEDRIVRMGSRSKSDLVMEKTLYNLRMHYREHPDKARNDGVKLSFPGRLFKMKDKLEMDMTALLDELTVDYVPLSKFLELGIITQSQHDSFGSDDWVTSSTEEEENPTAKSWLLAAPHVQDPNDIAFFDDAALKDDFVPEIDEEELQERVEEFMAGTVDDTKIYGGAVNVKRSIVCYLDDSVVGDIEPFLTMRNVQAIPNQKRLGVYKVWLQQYQRTIIAKLGVLARVFEIVCENIRSELRKNNRAILNTARVIGMTTTAASKYHDLLCLMKPKIMICEEASETMEAHLISALTPSVKHLILVGDHQQLRPSMSVNDLKDKNIDVSMFERLVTNNFPFTVLNCQRRMRPEIRSLINPIYKDLTDHRSVCSYDNVRGMVNNLWFLTHDEPDMLGGNNSHVNLHEVAIAAKLAVYLLQQGYKPSEITILAMYAGQRNLIKERLHKSMAHGAGEIHVSTVDGFQGEENEIIILSLVRSNTNNNIGFLKTSNRVCVGLSRAKKGMYILGNGKLLMDQSDLWRKVINLLIHGDNLMRYRIGNRIKLQCSRHPEMISEVGLEADFDVVREGGCSLPCNGTFPKSS
ncbi:hypothetical protein BGZ51_003999 [Haplosporangium sp. Z 767]|nr:hypothetical protein BGZ51_003999 [Haplosporangium sp. Z 767]KAF9195998.1 hypothetical protein BGZ50_002503 [Haplosporangium sp. Z 11]